MKVWHFSEQSYPDAWDKDAQSIRVTLPSRHFDPVVAADLLNRYLDDWLAADELGLNIMINEHHSTATCMSSSCTLPLAILARQTKKARLLALGIPIPNRPDPVRVAEEIAYIDLISHGRFEVGLIKGGPWELHLSNQNPVRVMERFWEAHDLILDALTTQDGIFSWEGKYFDYRMVNNTPRCFQQPHPPIWMTSSGPVTGRQIAQHGYVTATFMSGHSAKTLFDAYRKEYLITHGKPAPSDRFAYMAMVAVGSSEREAMERAAKLKMYMKAMGIVHEHLKNPPGYQTVEENVAFQKARGRGMIAYSKARLRDGRPLPAAPTHEEMIDAGILFAGTPDQVYEQIARFNDDVGGLGHLLMFGQAASMSHKETVDNLSLFAKEVYPRLKDIDLKVREAAA